jgi:AcrR family transcriptional regulator
MEYTRENMAYTGENLEQFNYYQPTQARAERTFSRILKTALDIIENEGIDALNTNRVAEDCQVNISTLYHYFPNKDSIVYALYKRWFEKIVIIAEQHRETITARTNSKKFYNGMIYDFLNIEGYPPKAAIALEQAIKVRSELAEFDEAITEISVKGYIEDLKKFGSQASKTELTITASLILIAVWGAITIAAEHPKKDHLLITEYTAGMIASIIKNSP